MEDNSYRAVALVTRNPQSSTKQQGRTSVINRVSDALNDTSCTVESPCHLYDRADKRNKGHFETWSWYENSVIPIQAPKMVHIESLHLLRPLTQAKFGVVLKSQHAMTFDNAFGRFKATDLEELTEKATEQAQGLQVERPQFVRAWSDVARVGVCAS
ncbi:MAG: hypothetical protein Q9218_006790 [Villophora microphyllina]